MSFMINCPSESFRLLDVASMELIRVNRKPMRFYRFLDISRFSEILMESILFSFVIQGFAIRFFVYR